MALNITSGIVDIPQGGTNAGTASGARVNLLPALAGNAGKVLAVNTGATDVEYISVGGSGTVTSVGLAAPAIFTVSGSPVTVSGTLTLSYSGTALPVANGGTGATTAATARTNFGATTVGSNLFTLTNPTAITFLRVNADNTVSTLDAATFRTAIGAGTSSTTGTVTSVGGTGTVSGLTLSGSVTTTGNLTLGGTLAVTASNFASQTANTFLAAPNGTAGVPTFRTIVAADVPTLNQSTTGTAANVTGTVAIANGGTGSTTAAGARTNFGATTVGSNFFTLANPSDIRFTRINADNTVSLLNDGDFRTAIGVGLGVTPTYTEITATAGQTSFSVSYTVGSIDVFLNGIRLNAADYTASTGTTIVLATPTLAGSILAVKTFTVPPVVTDREKVFYVSTNTSATATNTYVLLSSVTLTLPASPVEGDYVKVSNRSGTVTCVLGRNGSNIMGIAEDMTLDNANAGLNLVYTNSTNGWVFV